MTKNRWRSIDAHFHDGAGRVLLSVLPIKAAKNSVVANYNLSELWLPRTHDNKSLTFHWRSFSWWGREGIAICFAYKGGQEFLCDWLLVSAMVPDRRFRSGSGSGLNWCQIGGLGCQHTRTVNSGMVRCKSPTRLDWAGCQRVPHRVHL